MNKITLKAELFNITMILSISNEKTTIEGVKNTVNNYLEINPTIEKINEDSSWSDSYPAFLARLLVRQAAINGFQTKEEINNIINREDIVVIQYENDNIEFCDIEVREV